MITKELIGLFIVMALTAAMIETLCRIGRKVWRWMTQGRAERAAERRWDHLRD